MYITVTAIFFLLLPIIRPLGNDSVISFNSDSDSKPAVHISAKKGLPTDSPLKSKNSAGTKKTSTSDEDSDIGVFIAPNKRVNTPLDKTFRKLQKVFSKDSTLEERHDLSVRTLGQVPNALLFLQPLVAAALWLMYCLKRRAYVEHLVFVLHCHAFYFVVMTLGLLATLAPSHTFSKVFQACSFLWVMGYSLVALRRNYGQNWLVTLFKAFFHGTTYAILLVLCLFGSLIMAASSLPDKPAQASSTPHSAPKLK
jgi:hypothetical protein